MNNPTGNNSFDIGDWLPLFPLQADSGRYVGRMITSPGDICNNEQLRTEMLDQYHWGLAVPVDIFVMGTGEPQQRYVTKIGGLPYRSASSPWPTDENGKPMYFIGQINFADSKDIVGELPGDLLLVFADEFIDDTLDQLHLEWQTVGEKTLVTADQLPENSTRIASCFGLRYRTVSYPAAVRTVPYQNQRYPTCRGSDVWSDYLIPQYQATQIGTAPFFIQREERQLPGIPLCAISSVMPDLHSAYPFANHAEPLLPKGEWKFDSHELMFGDSGCIYISMDEERKLHWCWSCY